MSSAQTVENLNKLRQIGLEVVSTNTDGMRRSERIHEGENHGDGGGFVHGGPESGIVFGDKEGLDMERLRRQAEDRGQLNEGVLGEEVVSMDQLRSGMDENEARRILREEVSPESPLYNALETEEDGGSVKTGEMGHGHSMFENSGVVESDFGVEREGEEGLFGGVEGELRQRVSSELQGVEPIRTPEQLTEVYKSQGSVQRRRMGRTEVEVAEAESGERFEKETVLRNEGRGGGSRVESWLGGIRSTLATFNLFESPNSAEEAEALLKEKQVNKDKGDDVAMDNVGRYA